jgi:class 3 adenylate cyclase
MDEMGPPVTKYARAGNLHLAYQRFGSGPDVVLIPPLVSNVELAWDHELYRRVLEHDGRHIKMLMFDKRGIGCSDRFEQLPTLEERIGDITAVMDAEGIERASLLGMSEGGLMAQLFAARYPDRVDKLLLLNTAAGLLSPMEVADHVKPSERPLDVAELLNGMKDLVATWGSEPLYMVDWMMSSQADNASFVRWVGRLQRQTATPADLERQVISVVALDPSAELSAIHAPTLVMHVTGDRVLHVAYGRHLASRIAGASYVEIPGEDHFCWVMPNWRDIADCALEFLTGNAIPCSTERRFATVLFTDLVNSTKSTSASGDAAWRETLDSHDRICRDVIDRHQGRLVKNTGDGVLATFDSPSGAVSAATSLVDILGSIDLTIRAGIHAGEMEFRSDGDISGTAVNLAARVEQAADPGHVFVSSTVRDMLIGSEHSFSERGAFELKGIEGSWRLFALTA